MIKIDNAYPKDFAFSIKVPTSYELTKLEFWNQRKSNFSVDSIMKISNFKIIPILIGLLLCQVQACKSSTKKGYVQINQKEYEEQIKGLIEAVHREKEFSQKILEEREQNPISPVIQEEEMILEMMEKQELSAEAREKYVYIPAERDDQVTKTGRPKYLPVETSQSNGIGCSSKTK